jgi:hypothetical protein
MVMVAIVLVSVREKYWLWLVVVGCDDSGMVSTQNTNPPTFRTSSETERDGQGRRCAEKFARSRPFTPVQ